MNTLGTRSVIQILWLSLVFNVYDMDKNGSIEFNEFLHGLSGKMIVGYNLQQTLQKHNTVPDNDISGIIG